jgi:hypothetical protein
MIWLVSALPTPLLLNLSAAPTVTPPPLWTHWVMRSLQRWQRQKPMAWMHQAFGNGAANGF